MKKRIKFSIIALLFSLFSFGQKFDISKVFINGQTIKMKGNVEISDSKINIIQNDVKSEMTVTVVSKLAEYKEFIVENLSSEQYQIRFKFNIGLKTDEWTLAMETKDNFNGSIQSCVYYLKKIN